MTHIGCKTLIGQKKINILLLVVLIKAEKRKKEEKERGRRENFLDVNLMFLEIKIYFFVVCSCETGSLTSTFRHPGNGSGFCKEHEIF